jgi:drug/metabolite transporter (DMT)-like permease
MWRAGLLLIPWGLVEAVRDGLPIRADLIAVQFYCVVAGGVIAFAIWNSALRHWRASQVLLFNNLIPISTMGWAWVWLNESVTTTFWAAMILIVTGVTLGQLRTGRVAERVR